MKFFKFEYNTLVLFFCILFFVVIIQKINFISFLNSDSSNDLLNFIVEMTSESTNINNFLMEENLNENLNNYTLFEKYQNNLNKNKFNKSELLFLLKFFHLNLKKTGEIQFILKSNYIYKDQWVIINRYKLKKKYLVYKDPCFNILIYFCFYPGFNVIIRCESKYYSFIFDYILFPYKPTSVYDDLTK